MELKFTLGYDKKSISAKHSNVPEDTTWYELTEVFWDFLDSCGYHVDPEARGSAMDAIDSLMFERYLHTVYPRDRET
jgi:hypothetical protein